MLGLDEFSLGTSISSDFWCVTGFGLVGIGDCIFEGWLIGFCIGLVILVGVVEIFGFGVGIVFVVFLFAYVCNGEISEAVYLVMSVGFS